MYVMCISDCTNTSKAKIIIYLNFFTVQIALFPDFIPHFCSRLEVHFNLLYNIYGHWHINPKYPWCKIPCFITYLENAGIAYLYVVVFLVWQIDIGKFASWTYVINIDHIINKLTSLAKWRHLSIYLEVHD